MWEGGGCGGDTKVQQHLYVFMHKYVQELQKSDQLTVNTQDADEGGLVVTCVQHLSINVCEGMRQSVQHYVQRMQPTDRVQDADEGRVVATRVQQHLHGDHLKVVECLKDKTQFAVYRPRAHTLWLHI